MKKKHEVKDHATYMGPGSNCPTTSCSGLGEVSLGVHVLLLWPGERTASASNRIE